MEDTLLHLVCAILRVGVDLSPSPCGNAVAMSDLTFASDDPDTQPLLDERSVGSAVTSSRSVNDNGARIVKRGGMQADGAKHVAPSTQKHLSDALSPPATTISDQVSLNSTSDPRFRIEVTPCMLA